MGEQDLYRPMIDVVKETFEHFVQNRFVQKNFDEPNYVISLFRENTNEESHNIKIF